ncbi:MAG: YndM family protein [Clostridiales bacterium]|nr:YndM family protein [Clostridiales bacterium]
MEARHLGLFVGKWLSLWLTLSLTWRLIGAPRQPDALIALALAALLYPFGDRWLRQREGPLAGALGEGLLAFFLLWAMTYFLYPARHLTLDQLLVTAGAVAFIQYLWHRLTPHLPLR